MIISRTRRIIPQLGSLEIQSAIFMNQQAPTGNTMAGRLHANQVIGIDIDGCNIAFANTSVADSLPLPANRIKYSALRIEELPEEERYGMIVSKDALKHIIYFADAFRAMVLRRKPAGPAFTL